MVLKVRQYSGGETSKLVGRLYSVNPSHKGFLVAKIDELFPPQEAKETWEVSGKTDEDWEVFKQAVRIHFSERKQAIAKLVRAINELQDNADIYLLVSTDDYERSYEWCLEQCLTKGREKIHHTVEYQLTKYTPDNITSLLPNQIFVFGSNTEGRHGKGAAKAAMAFGACYGQARGKQGQAYAIVTKDLSKGERSIPLEQIGWEVEKLLAIAEVNLDKEFLVTKFGCSLAGYSVEEIAGLFANRTIPSNVRLPREFHEAIAKLSQDGSGDSEAVATLEQEVKSEVEPCTIQQTTTEVQDDNEEGASTFKDRMVVTHIHSDMSDGSAKVEQIVKTAVEMGHPAIALTDHGTMMGIADLYDACKKFGIKFIAGNEAYLEHPYSAIIESKPSIQGLNGDYKPGNRFHQIVLAKSLQGYKNLSKLTTWSELNNKKADGGRRYPLINFEKLEEHKEGLIVTSGCIGSLVPQLVIFGEHERAKEIVQWYKDVFADDFYIELQDHGGQKIYQELNKVLVEIGQELGCQFVITPDTHYLKECHYEVHSILYCIKYGKKLSDQKNNKFQYDKDLVFPTSESLKGRFGYLPAQLVDQAIESTIKIAEKVAEYELYRDPVTPKFQLPEGYTYESYFAELAENGLRDRFKGEEPPQNYKDRLVYELSVINSMGFASYFIVVADFIRHAREQKIRVGVGRGSAAGSLVAYATGITGIDPIHYGLSFERFLNEGRREMPDIDTDFHPAGREEIIRYVTEKYGAKRVAQICTYTKLTSKAVMNGVARVLDIPIKIAKEVAKMIPVSRGKPEKLTVMISEKSPSSEFRDKYLSDEEFKYWVDTAIQLENCLQTTGVHAAGVVIADSDIEEYIPLMVTPEGTVVTQYEMNHVGRFGYLKMDFLGLKNLGIIEDTLANIRKNRGEEVDIDNPPTDDALTYQIFAKGETTDIFQFGSPGMQDILRQLQPTNIEDLAVVNALYRPGALDSGMIPRYIARKHGHEPVEYDFPELEEALKDTYGVLVYQESVMKSSQVIAGFSPARADQLRGVVGKKKVEKMPKEREDFLEGGKARNFDESKLNTFFDKVQTFGEYGFNKSHAVSYSYLAFQCAYLKANYTPEYIAATLSWQSDPKKARALFQVAKVAGVELLPPDVNLSDFNFTPNGTHYVLFGLKAVLNLGEAAIASIVEARQQQPFTSLLDLDTRAKVNARGLKYLIMAGALDSLHSNRKQMMESIEHIKSFPEKLAAIPGKIATARQSMALHFGKLKIEPSMEALDKFESENPELNKTKRSSVEMIRKKAAEIVRLKSETEFKLADVSSDYTFDEKLRQERESIGYFVSGNPVEPLPQKDLFPTTVLGDSDEDEIEQDFKKWVTVSCAIVQKQDKIGKKSGKPYCEMILEDHAGTSIKCMAWEYTLNKEGVREMLEENLAFTGRFEIEQDDEGFQAILKGIGK